MCDDDDDSSSEDYRYTVCDITRWRRKHKEEEEEGEREGKENNFKPNKTHALNAFRTVSNYVVASAE